VKFGSLIQRKLIGTNKLFKDQAAIIQQIYVAAAKIREPWQSRGGLSLPLIARDRCGKSCRLDILGYQHCDGNMLMADIHDRICDLNANLSLSMRVNGPAKLAQLWDHFSAALQRRG
jgi:hypothetical protein